MATAARRCITSASGRASTPEDLRERTLYGKGRDWPLDYEQLRPYYDQVQEEVGLSGDAEQEIWRPPGAPYPLPPLPVFQQGRLLAPGLCRLGPAHRAHPRRDFVPPLQGAARMSL